MEYTLMHKNISVIDLEIAEESGYISKICMLHNIEHMPIGIKSPDDKDVERDKNSISRERFNSWWVGRSIPASRDGLRDILHKLGVCSPVILIDKCYGLSLSDQYWICPKNSGLTWETVNFFNNDFSKDIGEILFGHEPENAGHISLMSPDNTSDGQLRKKWVISDGKRYLIKGGSGFMEQEPFNEVIASALMRRLGIAHVEYTLTFENGKPYSLCENFITPETELIPAWRIMQTHKRNHSHSDYTHFLVCCDALGILDVQRSLDKMLTIDYIIANEDRHYNNFGAVRNSETLEWLGFAPIYDSGTSLWHTTPVIGSDTGCRPFKKTHAEQIRLAKDLSWFDFEALVDVDKEIAEILKKSPKIDSVRQSSLVDAIMLRTAKIRDRVRRKK